MLRPPASRQTSTRLKRLAKKIHAQVPELATISCEFGRLGLQEFGKPRRIVWISPGGVVDPAKRTNGTVTDETGKTERISVVAYRTEDVEAHIFAEDDEAGEAIFDALLAAVHLELGPNAPFPWKYGWAGDSHDAGAVNKMPKILLMFTARMPVSEQALGLRKIAHFQHGHSELTDKPHTDPHGP
jgi:hypothetical protein